VNSGNKHEDQIISKELQSDTMVTEIKDIQGRLMGIKETVKWYKVWGELHPPPYHAFDY